MRFGDYLKAMRIRKGLTLRDLSDKVNLGYAYLCEIENNKKTAPNDKVLLSLADILHLSATEKPVFLMWQLNRNKMQIKIISTYLQIFVNIYPQIIRQSLKYAII